MHICRNIDTGLFELRDFVRNDAGIQEAQVLSTYKSQNQAKMAYLRHRYSCKPDRATEEDCPKDKDLLHTAQGRMKSALRREKSKYRREGIQQCIDILSDYVS